MKLKTGMTFMMGAIAGAVFYEQMKNGNIQRFVEQKMRAEKKMIDDLEDMM